MDLSSKESPAHTIKLPVPPQMPGHLPWKPPLDILTLGNTNFSSATGFKAFSGWQATEQQPLSSVLFLCPWKPRGRARGLQSQHFPQEPSLIYLTASDEASDGCQSGPRKDSGLGTFLSGYMSCAVGMLSANSRVSIGCALRDQKYQLGISRY